jgi:DNA-binding response OmpR family regulator
MRVLIADDDEVTRRALRAMLRRRGHQVLEASDGEGAWQALQGDDPPRLAILDWLMPGLDGVEVCRRARAVSRLRGIYLILLTSREGCDRVVEGLRAGANDYMTKPFDPGELEARINVAVQVLQLQEELAQRIRDLEHALTQVKRLQGLLPICSYCKRIRDDRAYWHSVEAYLGEHSGTKFTHGVCPDCWSTRVLPEFGEGQAIPYPSV